MPKLTVSLPDGEVVVHELADEVITVGRVDDNLLQINDISVSSNHAQLTLSGGDYILQDLGSTNGTRVNGEDIGEGEDRPLQDGDAIIFGKVHASYGSEHAAVQPMPEGLEAAAVPATSSARPADFSNASPFQTKSKKKDSKAAGIMAFAGVSLLAFLAAVAMIFQMRSPL
ncbi:MAG TPA: FHA domain-containing protein [Chthoniobacteraceae bacterium]|jgi:pSer/pThr/pTyr-binding forkhead associated (FHA) protein